MNKKSPNKPTSTNTENVENTKTTNIQLIVFKVGNEEYGLVIDLIKEIVLTPTITKMPQTPNYIKGVANIRGSVIALIDLEEKFGIKTDAIENQKKYTLVIEHEEFKMGILVNQVPSTLVVSSAQIEDATSLITDNSGESNYIKSIAKVNNRLVIMIDIFKIMANSEIISLN